MILLDLNVLLDVVQKREPHDAASAGVIELAIRGDVKAALPAHAMTTIHYIVGRYQGGGKANEVVDWLLRPLAMRRYCAPGRWAGPISRMPWSRRQRKRLPGDRYPEREGFHPLPGTRHDPRRVSAEYRRRTPLSAMDA